MAQLTPMAKGLIAVIIISAGAGLAWKFGLQNKLALSPNSATSTTSPAPTPAGTNGTATAPTSPALVNATDDYPTIIAKGRLRVGVQGDAKPFYFIKNGTPQGFNMEFVKLLVAQPGFGAEGKALRIDSDHEVDTYAKVPALLLAKNSRDEFEVDIAVDGLTFQDDELPGVVYSIPYIDDFGYSLIVPSQSPLRSAADLEGKKVGILAGDPDIKAFAQRAFAKSKLVELSDASIDGKRIWLQHFIGRGEVAAVVYDYPFAAAEIEGSKLEFAVSKLPGSDIKYKIGVRKSSPLLLEKLNAAIRQVKASPQYGQLVRKYFSSSKIANVSIGANDRVYVVRAGDTLGTIAQKELGSTDQYRSIEALNNLPNPNLIFVGQKLLLSRK